MATNHLTIDHSQAEIQPLKVISNGLNSVHNVTGDQRVE